MLSISRALRLFVAIAALPGPRLAMASAPVYLQWTAPGDDGLVGQATSYDLRYSTSPITAANFAQATAVSGLPALAPAGTQEFCMVQGFNPASNYYAAIRTADERGNWSGLSNLVAFIPQSTGVERTSFGPSFSAPWPTRCSFTLPGAAWIRVDAFDFIGPHVRTLASGRHGPGRGELVWDLRDQLGRPVATGVYLVSARIDGRTWTERVAVVR